MIGEFAPHKPFPRILARGLRRVYGDEHHNALEMAIS